MLNGRVRNGNGCGHPGMVTGKLLEYQLGSGSVVDPWQKPEAGPAWFFTTAPGRRINADKRSAVSTGQLSGSPRLHTRPINPVVFREPSHLRAGGLISGWVSRL